MIENKNKKEILKIIKEISIKNIIWFFQNYLNYTTLKKQYSPRFKIKIKNKTLFKKIFFSLVNLNQEKNISYQILLKNQI